MYSSQYPTSGGPVQSLYGSASASGQGYQQRQQQPYGYQSGSMSIAGSSSRYGSGVAGKMYSDTTAQSNVGGPSHQPGAPLNPYYASADSKTAGAANQGHQVHFAADYSSRQDGSGGAGVMQLKTPSGGLVPFGQSSAPAYPAQDGMGKGSVSGAAIMGGSYQGGQVQQSSSLIAGSSNTALQRSLIPPVGNPTASSSNALIGASGDKPLQRGSDVRTAQSTAGASPSTEADEDERRLFAPLRTAKERVDIAMRADEESVPTLDAMLGQNGGQSGQYDPPPEYEPEAFRQIKHFDLPSALFAEMKKPGIRARQGLLPDIKRAWFVLDGILLLWDYNNEANRLDRCEHQAGSQVDCVGLVKANKDIFASEITHLLVVCGNAGVHVLGISYSSDSGSVKLIDTGILVATNGRPRFVQVTGSSTSRIFLLGDKENGCIYELKYNVAGWGAYLNMGRLQHYLDNLSTSSVLGNFLPSFGSGSSSAYRQILCDSYRGFIYALTERGGLELWTIPRDGSKPTRIQSIDDPLVQPRQQTFGSGLFDPPARVVALSLVAPHESKQYHLIAVTNTGCRLYMSTSGRTYGYSAYGSSNSLTTLHVRQPPRPVAEVLLPSIRSGEPNSIVADYMSGVFTFALNSPKTDRSTLLITHVNTAMSISFVARRNENAQTTLSETFTAQPKQGLVYAVVEEPSDLSDNARISMANKRFASNTDLVVSEMTSQVTARPRTFVILSGDGIQILARTTPLETLMALLQNRMSMDGLGQFSHLFMVNPSQLCSMDLAIACQGGEGTTSRSNGYSASAIRGFALEHLQHFAHQLTRQQQSYPGTKRSAVRLGLDALSIHVSRLLRGIWRQQVTRPGALPNTLESNLSPAALKGVQKPLQQALEFVESNASALGIAPEPSSASANEFDPDAEERELLRTFRLLLSQTIEAISFLLLLIDFKLPMIASRADPAAQESLKGLTYQGLVTTRQGREVAKMLVTTLINMQTGAQSSIESISNTLQQRCGTFCRPEDVILYKAWENIRKAKEARTRPDRDEYLHDAFDLFERGAAAMTVDRARETSNDFRQLGFAHGAINLPLLIAERRDPDHAAFEYYANGQSEDDPRKQAYQTRTSFYDLALDALAAADSQVENGLSDAARSQEELYNAAFASEDDLFLMYLYDWLVKNGRRDQLLELDRDDQVEMYLRHRRPTDGEQDLLWRFYARRGRHYMAALALRELADSPSSGLPLNQRVEALALAALHAKSSSSDAQERAPVDFVTEVEEQTEVANIQMEIWQSINNDSNIEQAVKERKLAELEQGLRDISELWADFAFPLSLLEIMLTILKVSDHRDIDLTTEIWETLFDRASEANDEFAAHRELVEKLGKRLYPSGAFPLDIIGPFLLGKAAASNAAIGSVFKTLRIARVSWYDIWQVIVNTKDEGNPPFDQAATSAYLDRELAALLPTWLKESKANLASTDTIPPTVVDDYLNSWLLEHEGSRGDDEIKKVFSQVARDVRKSF